MNKVLAFAHAYVGHGREAGAETTLANMLESLVRNGWEATVLLSEDTGCGEYTHNGVRVIPDARGRKTFPKIINQYDVVVSHLDCSEQAAVVCERSGIPIVHLVHNTMWQTESYLASGCDLAIYNTDWVADYHSENQSRNIISVPSRRKGLTTISFSARRARDWPWIVLHPQISPSDYYAEGPHDSIGFVNFHDNKNPDIFYEMAERFPDENFIGLIGGYGEQDVRDGYPNVEYIENTIDIAGEFYARTKILLVPSHYESFGRVALEGAATGIPCLASPTKGLLECLGHRGVYADPTDPDAWEDMLRMMLRPQNYNYLSTMALNCSKEWFETSTKESDNLIQVMNELVDRKRR
jgi:glycosyltransferase involved in cell wall biosynthesis